MEGGNFFQDTPIVNIWTEIILLFSRRSNFIVSTKSFRFSRVICERETVKEVFESSNARLELICIYTDRHFFCQLTNSSTSLKIPWKGVPPDLNKFNTINDLDNIVEEWMIFLEKELN
ncbi:MAG: hypothetical protein K2X37_07600 [Chitinophagaceae bacterium]|nr:hypothetical protein [Chitinophagaceae bacterium]